MDVATSLVVNHVNLGALCLLCYICVYGYVKRSPKKNIYIEIVKEVKYNLYLMQECEDL